jgi:hypothetical protein
MHPDISAAKHLESNSGISSASASESTGFSFESPPTLHVVNTKRHLVGRHSATPSAALMINTHGLCVIRAAGMSKET